MIDRHLNVDQLQWGPALRDPLVRSAMILLSLLLSGLAGLGLLRELSFSAAAFSAYDLSREGGFAAVVSALLHGVAGLVMVRVWQLTGRRSPLLLGAFLVFMAADEFFVIHERLGAAVQLNWQLLYAPVVLLGALAWASATRTWRWQPFVVCLMFLGAAAWALSQLLEALQWDGVRPVDHYAAYMLTEEVLEALGSSLFLLAGVVIIATGLVEATSTTSAEADVSR